MKKIYIYANAGCLDLSSCYDILREETEDIMYAESEDLEEEYI